MRHYWVLALFVSVACAGFVSRLSTRAMDAPLEVRPLLARRQPPATAAGGASMLAITRISVASDGTEGNRDSIEPALSSDGRFVAFQSSASNLVPHDTNGVDDIFVHDRLTGVTTRESGGSAGVQADANCEHPSISADGRFVAFASSATTLVPGVPRGRFPLTQMYVRDRQLGLTTIASISGNGMPADEGVGIGDGSFSLSDDGRFLSFSSNATNLVAGASHSEDIFTHDMSTGATTRDSVASDGTQAAGARSFDPLISRDGRYVAFLSNAVILAPGLINLPPGVTSFGADFLFVRDRSTGRTTLESIGPNGELLVGHRDFSFSADGRFVAFTGSDSHGNGGYGVYLRDRQTRETRQMVPSSELLFRPHLSADGRFLSYTTSEDAFREYLQVLDRSSGQFTTITACDCFRGMTAVAGYVIAFVSSTPLIDNDRNFERDVYVAVVAAQPGAPDPPTSLTHLLSGSALTLSWTPARGGSPATEYVIEAGTVSRSTDAANFPTGSTTTSFSTPVDSRSTFYIRVRAANAAGVSLPSNEIVVAIGALPGAPTGLTAAVIGNAVTLTWSPATGPVVSYVIEAGSGSRLADLANFSTGTTATSFSASGVAAGTYFVRVRAASPGGVGLASNEVAIVVPGAP